MRVRPFFEYAKCALYVHLNAQKDAYKKMRYNAVVMRDGDIMEDTIFGGDSGS
jgi:hypothetical protein